MDGDRSRMAALVRSGAEPPPDMLAVAREAEADALDGKNPRLRNHKPADLRRTLAWRAGRSWRIKQDMRPTWTVKLLGESLNQAVADRVNAEWQDGGIPWYVAFDDKHKATARTVADDAREVAKNLR